MSFCNSNDASICWSRIVDKTNNSIGQDPDSNNLIGVLDIYGFESFKTNRCLANTRFFAQCLYEVRLLTKELICSVSELWYKSWESCSFLLYTLVNIVHEPWCHLHIILIFLATAVIFVCNHSFCFAWWTQRINGTKKKKLKK